MQKARGGMGNKKHGTSGHAPKSPAFRHTMKREAESHEIKDRSRIKEPKSSVRELFNQRKKP